MQDDFSANFGDYNEGQPRRLDPRVEHYADLVPFSVGIATTDELWGPPYGTLDQLPAGFRDPENNRRRSQERTPQGPDYRFHRGSPFDPIPDEYESQGASYPLYPNSFR